MRNKLLKARPHSFFSTSQSQDNERSMSLPSVSPLPPQPSLTSLKSPLSKAAALPHERPSFRATLTPASEGPSTSTMPRNSTSAVNGTTQTQSPQPSSSIQPSAASLSPSSSPQFPNRMNSTIRTVSSFEDRQRLSGEDSSSEGTQSHSNSRNSALSSSITSMSSSNSQPYSSAQTGENGLTPTRGLQPSGSMIDIPQRASSLSKTSSAATLGNDNAESSGGSTVQTGPEMTPNELSLSAGEATMSANWDNSVGKAGLGKTGRVINRLVSDNDALKRDIHIEQLKAKEAQQTARLLEDKLDRTISEYESRLLEANVTKTLLARKERQVESLQASVELEKSRAVAANDRERVWKETLEETRAESKRKVDEATNFAALMEGRYNALSSHWKEQGADVKRLIAKMGEEVAELNEKRREDDFKIRTLEAVCEQQDQNIRKQQETMRAYVQKHEEYVLEQEKALKRIKTDADLRVKEYEDKLAELTEALDKMKWVVNVKKNIPWAE
ncbi:hypothetical protein QBC38DRAFT_360290 [Podospora fimiseda]|uniref:SWI5-dependent HO expression protein 3 n=1 Tax=Podospora fimiseda TaxID=252190 RepID=A0AAN7BT53_9PEZI|nr:hypothetical protein QBC38DRAFT_360290 [Podospora fimiseda]